MTDKAKFGDSQREDGDACCRLHIDHHDTAIISRSKIPWEAVELITHPQDKHATYRKFNLKRKALEKLKHYS